MPKFIEPMLSEHISGLATSGAASRCSTVMLRPPPVVTLMTASVDCLMRGRNCMNTAGSGVGRPSLGSRACRWRIEAPASAAAIDCAAISSGVKGSALDIVGVWMPPVMAQVMMTLSDRGFAIVYSLRAAIAPKLVLRCCVSRARKRGLLFRAAIRKNLARI